MNNTKLGYLKDTFSQEFTNVAIVSAFCVGSAVVLSECARLFTDLRVPTLLTILAMVLAGIVQLAVGGMVVWKECNRPTVRTARQFFVLWASCFLFAVLIPATAGGIIAVALILRNNPDVRFRLYAGTSQRTNATSRPENRMLGLSGLFADVLAEV